MKLEIGLTYVAWYSFVFAMCYFFSPWFVLLIMLQIIHEVFKPTLELIKDIFFYKIRHKLKPIADPVMIDKIIYKTIEDEIKRRISK